MLIDSEGKLTRRITKIFHKYDADQIAYRTSYKSYMIMPRQQYIRKFLDMTKVRKEGIVAAER